VVSTDDLQMAAVASRWSPAERSVLAAGAGCDLLEVCSSHDDQVEAMEGLIRAVEAEEVSRKATEAAEGRVRRLKDRFLEGYRDPDPRAARDAAQRGEHRALAEEIATTSGLGA
jgi:beta-glucosidase-like glycosyl hydrolase